MIESGIKVADYNIYQADKIWSRYSNDKVHIGEELASVIRTLSKALPLSKTMRALSIGSSAEPQFRILETAFKGGLYLLDVERAVLDIVKERIQRQKTGHVKTILGDYKKVFLNPGRSENFLNARLDGIKTDLITLHHSFYYCEETMWSSLFDNLYRNILAPTGAMHAVLMTAEDDNQYTTTWLYNHFVGKFFGHRNNQDLLKFKKELEKIPLFKKAQVLSRTDHVQFFTADFEKFMAVIWMVLLHPVVHNYSPAQREEITEFVYKKFWREKRPLMQAQDHLVVYRGIDFKGLI